MSLKSSSTCLSFSHDNQYCGGGNLLFITNFLSLPRLEMSFLNLQLLVLTVDLSDHSLLGVTIVSP